MTAIAYQSSAPGGVSPTFAAANAGGNEVPANDRGLVLIKNGGGSSINVTLAVPGNTKYGLANPDPVTAVAAGAIGVFGPFGADLADFGTDGLVHLTFSSVTTVTIAAVSF